MADLKVWVDGKERVICGVSEETACESIILVLAKAAKKSGKLALLEKWRDFERILPPDENPLRCIEAWGAYRNEVSLILQYEESTSISNQQNNTSVNCIVDDKLDVIKYSTDCESLENLTSFQQRKLQRLERAIEILDLQFRCWDNNEEAFLYLTEDEIVEDLSVKLSHALKLQAKELVEFKTWKTELNKLQKNHEKIISQYEIAGDRVEKVEAKISESYIFLEELLEEIKGLRNQEESPINSQMIPAHTQEELNITTRELDKQIDLFQTQEQDLKTIISSVSELDTSLQLKYNEIKQLKNEIDKQAYDILDDFRPQIPEAESKSTSREVNSVVELTKNFESSRSSIPFLETQNSGSTSKGVANSYHSDIHMQNDKISTHSYSRTETFPSSSRIQPLDESEEPNDEKDFNENSRPVFPLTSSTKCSNKTKMSSPDMPTLPYTDESSLSSPRTYDSPSQRKESFKKMKESFEKLSTQDSSKAFSKPIIKPKPKRNHILAPQLKTTTTTVLPTQQILEESKYSTKSTRDHFKYLSGPKPFGSHSSSFGTTSKGPNLPLSYNVNSRTNLINPAVFNKRSHPQNHKLINKNDTSEHGVFV